METHQIYSLVSLILASALLYWIGYLCGRSDGRIQGRHAEQAAHEQAVKRLKEALGNARRLNWRMRGHCETVDARSRMGEEERKTLLQVAAKLTVAAETFRALPADQSQVDATITLRNKTLIIASLLAPIEMGDAA
ncbi:hypothetical protein M2401_001145 [Pseudomonas sp. JUb42]|uniref:hypothetical protein n=1 Tax=Pseudomonas sp. JUb42 TaxID=2940611 RepID=UPI002168D1CC|nr:hypothetical protein [Pseudomonas sp. JUb42]MCS3467424.1 hypothetical protein [Pseudomonas sp. JUb42]